MDDGANLRKAAHALLDRVLDLDPAARERALEEACAGQPALRERVEAMLRATGREDGLLDSPPVHVWGSLLDDEDPVLEEVGPYRIVRELGRGGMGAVYLAERADGQFEKQVALKLVKRGMDTDEILARFRRERGILAGLEHPHIARLYDGGVSHDGRPYLVMEAVDGVPITTYCDSHRLSIAQRIELFCDVCAAVQHAHQMLVVHRDLKPSNILVTPEGTPRLLDFGIAKLLTEDDDSSLTRTGVRVLTPDYAAPEQLRDHHITTATDVYALGAILHQLLTGRRPVPASGRREDDQLPARPSAAVRTAASGDEATATAVAEARGTVPGRLERQLAGDLDVIVLRAMHPDPAQRYTSAEHLMDDLRRHLAGLPVVARAPTWGYRLGKFAQRNRGLLAAAALLLISLTGGLGATLWQAQGVARQRDAANLARSNAEEVSAFLVNMFDSADPLGVRSERTDTLRVRDLVDRGAARVREQLASQPRLQGELLTVIGRVYANLALFPAADSVLEEAVALLAAADASADAVVPRAVLANSALQQGRFERADSLLQAVLATYDSGARAPDSLGTASLSERGLVLGYLGRYDEARALHEAGLADLAQLGATGTAMHARMLTNYGSMHFDLGEYEQAERLFTQALELERSYLPPGHARLASTLNNIGSSVQYQGRLAEAEPLFREAVEIGRSGLGELHSEVGVYLQNLATLYDDQQRYEDGAAAYRESLRVHEAALGRDNVNTALLLRNFALNRYAVGALDEAEDMLREALGSMHAGVGSDHLYTGVTAAALGRVLTAAGKLADAESHIRTGLEILEAQFPDGHYLIDTSRRDLGAWYARRGDYETAEGLLLASHAALLASRGADSYLTREAREKLHRLYTEWGRRDDAAKWGAGGGR